MKSIPGLIFVFGIIAAWATWMYANLAFLMDALEIFK